MHCPGFFILVLLVSQLRLRVKRDLFPDVIHAMLTIGRHRQLVDLSQPI
jgi:hypothetical protein